MRHGSPVKLARIADISTGYLSQILSGNRKPPWPTAKRLAKATGTDPVDWVEGRMAKIKAAINSNNNTP